MTQTAKTDPRAFTPHSLGGDRGQADVLSAFARGFFEGAGPALVTILNQPVTLGVSGVEPVTVAELLGRLPLPWVLVRMPYARGFTGAHALVFPVEAAVAFGQALVGDAEPQGDELLPAHEEALREAANQMLLSAPATLGSALPRSVAFGAAQVLRVDEPEGIPPDVTAGGDRLWLIRAEVLGPSGFRAALTVTVSADLAREMADVSEAHAAVPASPAGAVAAAPSRLDLILDITLPVTVELGRTRMQIQDVLKLAPGSVIELEKSAGDPVDLYINDRPVAKGEVVVIDENFGVRLTSIVTATERIRSLR